MSSPSEKLIITAALVPPWLYTKEIAENVQKRRTQTPEEYAEQVYKCYQAGCSIAHIHGAKPWPKDKWAEIIRLIREKCDIIIQIGSSSLPLEERRGLMELRPEMMSIMVSHHDERFTDKTTNRLHTIDEIQEYLKACDEWNIKPELEIWHTGGIWNLRFLLERNILKPPPYLTLFFGWPGGTWTPPTFEELMYRVKNLPSGCVYCTSSMADPRPNSLYLSTLSIMLGGHVRVGTEDYPYLRPGVLAKDNSELVARIARISRELNREVATPDEAREIIGI